MHSTHCSGLFANAPRVLHDSASLVLVVSDLSLACGSINEVAISRSMRGKKNGGLTSCSFRWSGYIVAAIHCNTGCSEEIFGKL